MRACRSKSGQPRPIAAWRFWIVSQTRRRFARRIRARWCNQIGGESIAQATPIGEEPAGHLAARSRRGLFASEVISRTEILRASNTAAHAIYEQ
jgi:hypothetical protein